MTGRELLPREEGLLGQVAMGTSRPGTGQRLRTLRPGRATLTTDGRGAALVSPGGS